MIDRLFFPVLFALSMAGSTLAADLPPSDGGKKQLVIVGQPDSVPAKWFTTHPELSKVKASTAYTLLSPNAKLFRERYQSTLGTDFPIVAYLRADGGVIYFADRNNLPSTADGLFQEMKAAAFLAKNAEPAFKLPEDFEVPPQLSADCPDGYCEPIDDPLNSKPRFPRLRPFDRDGGSSNPLEVVEGFFGDTISSGLWLVFSIVALGFVFLFFVLIIGAMIVVAKLIR